MGHQPTTNGSRKVLLIGWDAADWKVIHPLLDAGKMPNLSRLIERGVIGNIATLQPALSPMLWTSIATGKRPYKHGIHGFSEPDPVSGGIRPVTNLSRSTKAIWNILNQCGKNTITVGWWPSNPAEPLSRGVMVSNDYQTATDAKDSWPLKPGTIHPTRLEKDLGPLRFHPSELTEDDLRAFLPGLAGMSREELDEVEKDPRLLTLMKTIADCTSIHSAATGLMQNEPWDLMCVYYDAIDHFGHAFMKYHPPQRPQVDDWGFRVYRNCVEAGYLYHDAMLGTLLHLAGEETTVILMSDHGFHPDDLRLNALPREPAGPAAEHRQFGIFVAAGPGIRRDQRIHGASLLDICPTLLHLFGLPVGEDMDGKVLLDVYDSSQGRIPEIKWIPSWDDVPGDHGMHPPDKQISPADSKAALQQLVDLGYIKQPSADAAKALEETVRELDYNLAQAFIDGGLFSEAAGILERLYSDWPMEHRFGFKLAVCYQSQNRPQELREHVRMVIERRMHEAELAARELADLGLEDDKTCEAERLRVEAMNERDRGKLLHERRELIAKSRPNLFSLRYLEATADFSEKKYDRALAKLEALDTEFGARRNALALRGEVLQKLRRLPESRAAFEEVLALDPEAPGALLGLARTALAASDFDGAVEYARRSLGLLYFQPVGHYLLGVAHYRLGQWQEARLALHICVSQAPLFSAGFRMLGQIAKLYQKDPQLQTEYALRLRQSRERLAAWEKSKCTGIVAATPNRENGGRELPMPMLNSNSNRSLDARTNETITLVSGLPRSGTSLMMQILEAAGIKAFSDQQREADDSNQRGYFEHEKVMALLATDCKAWLADARGHSLKVVAPLLSALPQRIKHPVFGTLELRFRVIFMEREMGEILASQETMLTRLGKPLHSGKDIARVYRQQVRHAKTWLNESTIPALSISFADLVHQPEDVLPALAAFLGLPEKLDSMRSVIDPDLHRVRLGAISLSCS